MSEVERLARTLSAAQGWSWLDTATAEREGNFSCADYCDHIRAILQAMLDPSEETLQAGAKAAAAWCIGPSTSRDCARFVNLDMINSILGGET